MEVQSDPFYKVGCIDDVCVVADEIKNVVGTDVEVYSGEKPNNMSTMFLRWFSFDIPTYLAADSGVGNPHNLWVSTECEWTSVSKLFVDTRALVHQLMLQFGASRLGTVVVIGRPPGSKVKPHCDTGLTTSYYKRLYIPVICEPGNVLLWKGEDGNEKSTYAKPGEIWTGDFKQWHSALNGSNKGRYVLTIDLKV